jgi:hypothetical protein
MTCKAAHDSTHVDMNGNVGRDERAGVANSNEGAQLGLGALWGAESLENRVTFCRKTKSGYLDVHLCGARQPCKSGVQLHSLFAQHDRRPVLPTGAAHRQRVARGSARGSALPSSRDEFQRRLPRAPPCA